MSARLFKQKQGAETSPYLLPEQPTVSPELEPLPEALPEQKREKEGGMEKQPARAEAIRQAPVSPPQATRPVQKTQSLAEIEKILESDLEQVYFSMDPATQQQFKVKGEETATKIDQMLREAKVKVKDIFKLIVEWLKIIPGISNFYIKQEAKIKTDKILKARTPEKTKI